MQLAFSLSKSEKPILTIGVNFEELGLHRGFYLFGIFFLSVVCDKACQSISSTQQAEGQPSPLTCFIYLGVSSRDSKKFNEFDACLLAISKKSRKTWNYLFPQVMSTWRNISKEGKYWYTYQNKHNFEPSAHFRACTAAIRSTEKRAMPALAENVFLFGAYGVVCYQGACSSLLFLDASKALSNRNQCFPNVPNWCDGQGYGECHDKCWDLPKH